MDQERKRNNDFLIFHHLDDSFMQLGVFSSYSQKMCPISRAAKVEATILLVKFPLISQKRPQRVRTESNWKMPWKNLQLLEWYSASQNSSTATSSGMCTRKVTVSFILFLFKRNVYFIFQTIVYLHVFLCEVLWLNSVYRGSRFQDVIYCNLT